MAGRSYFVTVRLADSIPTKSLLRLQEIHQALAAIEPRSTTLSAQQRQYFLTMEKYLDKGAGGCVLRHPKLAEIVRDELASLHEWHVDVPHYVIMPNHWHALLTPQPACARPLMEIMKRIKGRSGLLIRKCLGNTGAVWQREWFDHWVRDEVEWTKIVNYIHANPVKAGLVPTWQEHPWTQ